MLETSTARTVRYLLPGRGRGGRADAVLCDMAHSFVGEAGTDTILQQRLSTAGWEFAEQVLKPGGTFLVKVRHGPLSFDGEGGSGTKAQGAAPQAQEGWELGASGPRGG